MRRLSSMAALISSCAFVAFVAYPQDSARLEKVAEGEYWEWQDGHPVKDTTQTWTIWRTSDGYEVEDKLPPDKGAALMAVMGAALAKNMSPELREDLRNASTTTDIHLQLTKERAIRTLLLNGKKLSDAKQVQMANCRIEENEISCKGREGTAHLKNSGQDQLVYSYPFPLLFTPMLKQSKPALNQTIPVKLAVLEEVKNKLQLTEVPGVLHGEGPEKLVVGQYTLDTEKYVLAFEMKTGPRQITLWTRNQGTVFAMEDSRLASGLRVMLSQYKKYSDF
jgi:hypothetical protein